MSALDGLELRPASVDEAALPEAAIPGPDADQAAAGKAASGGPLLRHRLTVRGVVQGVGFRPFVYGLAQRLQRAGSVRNVDGGVA
ncbi:MAG: acylphosphatase, partial [Holophagales bacterium]|nr:acylphosphatase [Holophagales bacterium]